MRRAELAGAAVSGLIRENASGDTGPKCGKPSKAITQAICANFKKNTIGKTEIHS
jgi:hypothetical protein